MKRRSHPKGDPPRLGEAGQPLADNPSVFVNV